MKKHRIIASIISLTLAVTAIPTVSMAVSADSSINRSLVLASDSGKSAKDKLKDFIDDNKLDASVYIFPSGYGYLTSIAYYESDTETLDKIKAFMKAEGISESAIRFKAYKGEKPNGGMIKDYAVILPKIVKCIEDNKLNAQIMLWDSRYTTEIDYSLYLDGESPDGFNIPDGYVFKTETIFNIVVKCLYKNQIIIDTMDAMFENENIDPSTVQYFLLLNGQPDTLVNGDANGDGQVSMADAVLIMQYISNPDKYGENGTDKNHITEQGKKNADIAGENDGVTNADALAIQKKLLKLD